jgi:hypothetical protein
LVIAARREETFLRLGIMEGTGAIFIARIVPILATFPTGHTKGELWVNQALQTRPNFPGPLFPEIPLMRVNDSTTCKTI